MRFLFTISILLLGFTSVMSQNGTFHIGKKDTTLTNSDDLTLPIQSPRMYTLFHTSTGKLECDAYRFYSYQKRADHYFCHDRNELIEGRDTVLFDEEANNFYNLLQLKLNKLTYFQLSEIEKLQETSHCQNLSNYYLVVEADGKTFSIELANTRSCTPGIDRKLMELVDRLFRSQE